jgi:hypothetical protein
MSFAHYVTKNATSVHKLVLQRFPSTNRGILERQDFAASCVVRLEMPGVLRNFPRHGQDVSAGAKIPI